MRSHFWPFSEVLRKILRCVTRKLANDCKGSRVGCLASDAGGTPATTELLRREGGDDFFEARIAAQRIPEREQFQVAIGKEADTPEPGRLG